MAITLISAKNSYGEFDLEYTLRNTLKEMPAGSTFTADEMAAAIQGGHPEENAFLTSPRKVRQLLSNMYANPMQPARYFMLDEQKDGTFVRRPN